MSAKTLRQGIFDDDLQSIYFFNRRLLSGDDLQQEQRSTREHERRLGSAIGDGIAWGFEISRKSGDSAPNVLVSPGIAVNRRGRVLSLSNVTEVALVPTADPAPAGTDDFGDCGSGAPGVYLGAVEGLYLLVVAPATGKEGGLASASGLGNGIVACNSKFQSEGVQFRMISLNTQFTNSELADVVHLRNLAAYRCYEGSGVTDNPFQNTSGKYGLLDTLRPSTLTDCDVPLAILHWPTVNQLGFIDAWSVRRRIATSLLLPGQVAAHAPLPHDARWVPYNGERRITEADARFQQFQDQMNAIQLEGSSVTQNLRATDRYQFLPPSGYLPLTATGFSYQRFLGNLIRQPARKVNKGLMRSLIHRAWTMDPIDLSLTLPTPVDVWFPSDSDAFVLFTRSILGRVLVSLSGAATATPQLTLNADDSSWKSVTTASAAFGLSADVPAGPYSAAVEATGFVPVTKLTVTAIPGETVLLSVTLVPLPKGRITVTVTSFGRDVSDLIAGVTVSKAGTTGSNAVRTGNRFIADQLDSGVYTVSVDGGSRFLPGAQSGINVSSGSDITIEIQIQPRDTKLIQPSRRITVEKLERPPIAKADLVLIVERAEQKGVLLFFSVQPVTGTIFTTGAQFDTGLTLAATTSNRTTVIRKEATVDTNSVSVANYKTYSPALKYEVGAAAVRLTAVALPDTARRWLLQWRDYLGQLTGADAVIKAAPAVYIDNALAVRTSGATVQNWQAVAEFGPITIPMLIVLDSMATQAPVTIGPQYVEGIGQQKIDILTQTGIRLVDELSVAPEFFLIDTLGDPPPEFVESIVVDAGEAVTTINQNFGFLEGVDQTVATQLHQAGMNDLVTLANADVTALGAALGKPGLAIRLVSQARDLLPVSAFSLEALPLSTPQREKLEASGVQSLGDFQRKTATAAHRTALGAVLVPDATANQREQILTDLLHSAVSEQAFSSVQLFGKSTLLDLPDMDGQRAQQLSDAGFASVGALAAADKTNVAAAAGVSESVAAHLIDVAAQRSVGSASLGILAPISADVQMKLSKAKVHTLAGMLDSKNAAAVSKSVGDAGIAKAIANGVRRALKT